MVKGVAEGCVYFTALGGEDGIKKFEREIFRAAGAKRCGARATRKKIASASSESPRSELRVVFWPMCRLAALHTQ